MKKQDYYNDWEEFAELDSKWAILSAPDKKYNKWDEEEFFKTGKKEVKYVMDIIKSSNNKINFDMALDFGCGIGRVTQALARHFENVYGVDVSEKMIFKAKEYNKNEKITFIQNTADDLKIFDDNKFNFIYSVITLQHIPDKNQIKNYLKEFFRVLKPGGVLFFQLPSIPNYLFFKEKLLKLRGFLYYILVYKFGISKKFCYLNLRLKPFMYMNYMSSNEVKDIFSKNVNRIWIINNKTRSTRYLIKK